MIEQLSKVLWKNRKQNGDSFVWTNDEGELLLMESDGGHVGIEAGRHCFPKPSIFHAQTYKRKKKIDLGRTFLRT